MDSEIVLTGNPQTDQYLLSQLDDPTLNYICSTNSYTQSLCNETFFQNLISSKYNYKLFDVKPNDTTNKQWYFTLGKYFEDGINDQSVDQILADDQYLLLDYIYHYQPDIMPSINKIVNTQAEFHTPKIITWLLSNQELVDHMDHDDINELASAMSIYVDVDNYLELKRLFKDNRFYVIDHNIFEVAIGEENEEAIDKLYEAGLTQDDILDRMLLRDKRELADKYFQKGFRPSDELEPLLAMYLDLPGLQWLHSYGYPLTVEGANNALFTVPSRLDYKMTTEDQIDVLNFYLEQGILPEINQYIIGTPEALDWATKNLGQVEITNEYWDFSNEPMVLFLLESGYLPTDLNFGAEDEITLNEFIALIRAGYELTFRDIIYIHNREIQNFILESIGENV